MTKQPNVLLIISDQWSTRISDGSGELDNGIETPHVDSLAVDGMRFTNSYSTFPLCGPARATMFTGLYPHHHNFTDNQETFQHFNGDIPTRHDIATMGKVFKDAGYSTAYFGKEHAGEYGWSGIDEFGTYKNTGGGWIGDGATYDPVFTRDTIDYLKRDHDKPFYAVLSLINPHDICVGMPGSKMADLSIADAISMVRYEHDRYLRDQPILELPSNYGSEAIKGMKHPNNHSYDVLESWTDNDWQRYKTVFGLLTENTDWLIGLVLDTLRKQGLEDDTIVAFTTDHGEMLGSHKLNSKTVLYEESANTMMIVRHPQKIEGGKVNNEAMVGTIDLMPTLIDLAGVEVPADLDGRSFKADCYGTDETAHTEVFSMNDWSRMVRFGNYKYVRSQIKDDVIHILYDLDADPDETTNVFGDANHAESAKHAYDRMDAWLAEQKLEITFKPLS